MSTDIEAPDLSLNVRYSRKDEENGGEHEEVEIYENMDTLTESPPDPGSHEVRPLTLNNPSAVKRRRFGASAVVLGVLYLLIFAGVYMRNVVVTLEKQSLMTERDELNISLNQEQARNMNLTEERDELQTRYDNLTRLYGEREKERDRLQTRYDSVDRLHREWEKEIEGCKEKVRQMEGCSMMDIKRWLDSKEQEDTCRQM